MTADRPRGGQPRTGKPSRNRLVVLLDDAELAQLDAYVAKHGRDRSHWVRLAMVDAGLLRRPKGARKTGAALISYCGINQGVGRSSGGR